MAHKLSWHTCSINMSLGDNILNSFPSLAMDWIRKMLLHDRELLYGENKGLIYLSFDMHFLKTLLHTS
jgi:hypothetical protein